MNENKSNQNTSAIIDQPLFFLYRLLMALKFFVFCFQRIFCCAGRIFFTVWSPRTETKWINENDNLLIFYTGHEKMMRQPYQTEEGFVVPQNVLKDMFRTYISSDNLIGTIKYSKAKHILL